MRRIVFFTIITGSLLITGSPALAGFTLTQGDNEWAIDPIQGTQSATDYYNYRDTYKWSGDNEHFDHLVSKLYLYEDTSATDNSVSLVMHHSMKNKVDPKKVWIPVNFGFTDLPTGTSVALADDNGELTVDGSTGEGDWQFRRNSDGGVLSGLSTAFDWCITIAPNFGEQLTSWIYVDPSHDIPNLDMEQEVQLCYTTRTSGPPAVPAPGALLLGAIGTTCIGWYRKRRMV